MSCCPEHKENHKENHSGHMDDGEGRNHSSHKEHEDHKDHGSMMMHGGPGMAKEFLKRFFIVTFFLIPLLLLTNKALSFLGLSDFPFRRYLQFGFATVIFYYSLVFFEHAKHEITARQYGMMTLVSLAVGAGYLFSAASTFLPVLGDVEFYIEISTLIWVLLFGHYLEARSSSAAGNALQEVAKLLPKQAHLLIKGKVKDVDLSELKKGDIVLIKPGEKMPADGVIEKGSANVDEALISGESKPVQKGVGDNVVAGSVCIDGSLEIRLQKVGENSTIGQIQNLIKEAQKTKPSAQKIADKASGILTFTALSVAVITMLVWSLVLGESLVFGLTLAITVLVIACPHALGLAIPTVSTIATQLAVKNGVFIKDLAKLEVVKDVDYVVFDKTGTLTEGEFGVTDVVDLKDDKMDVLQIAASLEEKSSHLIGISIVNFARKKGVKVLEAEGFKNIAGKGIYGKIKGEGYYVGNKALMEDKKLLTEDSKKILEKMEESGKTTILLADKSGVMGVIALSDKVRSESVLAVDKLHELGIKVAMLTGDNEKVAEAVAKEIDIDTYFAQVLPEDKYKYIKKLQDEGNKVMMVGDGVNDAPALTQADVGVAIGAGTDVAVESGDVVLTRNNPQDITRLVVLGKKVYRKMVENLVWALGYNIVAIPAAAGLFAPFGFFLKPEVGALLMSLSSVIVVVNAMILRKADLEV